MADVVHLSKTRSLAAQRADALLGHAPIVTFQPDAAEFGSCCSVRLVRGNDELWWGLARDQSLFTDRIRLGATPRFVVYHEGETPVVCGAAEVVVRGRLVEEPTDVDGTALDALLAGHPFSKADLVVLEVRLTAVQVDDGEAPLHGAIPRT